MLLAQVDIYEALLGMVAFATIVLAVLSVRDRSRRNVREERDELLTENTRQRSEIAALKQELDKLEARTDLTRLAGMIDQHEKRAAERHAHQTEQTERQIRVLDRIARKLEINGKERP